MCRSHDMEDRMKNSFFPSLRHGINCAIWFVCCAFHSTANAGGIDILTPSPILHVTIPAMKEGLGFTVEGSALRVYDNNLSYVIGGPTITTTEGVNTTVFSENMVEKITPGYAGAIRASIDYTFSDYANVLSLVYEHLFSRDFSSSATDGESFDFSGSMRQKLDAGAIISEQHILIGPFWETTFTGGARFAHLEQTLSAQGINSTDPENLENFSSTTVTSYRFNGAGPLLGLNAMFNVFDFLSLGAEMQGTLLLGKNNLSIDNTTVAFGSPDLTYSVTNDISPIYSLVPELYYRLYANFFFRTSNDMEFQLEAGWRANQFFNIRTFDRNPLSNTYGIEGYGINSTTSSDIGFSGPYLRVHVQL